MEILILCGIYLVELLCYLILLQMLFDVRIKTKVWLIVGIALPIILGFLSVDISGKIFCVSISVVLVMLVSIEGSYIEKGIRLVLTLLLLECVNGIFTNPCEKLMILIGNNYMRDLNYLLTKCCTIIFIIMLSIVKVRIIKKERTHINSKIYLVLGSIVVSMMFSSSVLNYAVAFLPNDKYVVFCNIVNFAIYVSIFLLITFVLYIKNANERMEQLLKTERLLKESQVKYYEQMLKKENDTRKYRHDMMNHLIYLRDILGRNKIDDAQKYVSSILGGFKKIQNTYYTIGNEMIDTIMNYYLGMLPNDTKIDITRRCPVIIEIEDTDVCTIFSNVFQNAIDEIVNNNIKDPKIVVSVKKGMQYVSYSVKNTMSTEIDKKYIDKNGFPKSHKLDKCNHGIGLINVQSAIERNNGKFEWHQKDGYFCVNIILRIK